MTSPRAGALVACIGNGLVADDAVGWAVYQRLSRRKLPPDTRLELLACGGMALLERMAGERLLVVVDAVQMGAPCGTVHVLDWDRLPAAGQAVSAHGIGVREAVEMGRIILPGSVPREVVLIGIEGRCFDAVGEAMTPAVAAAVPRAARAVLRAVAAPHAAGKVQFAHEYAT